MRRFWIVWPVVLVLLLTGTSLALARRSREVMQVSESNGHRTLIVRKFGLIPVARVTAVPGLNVTAEFKRDLRRQGLSLPARVLPLLSGVYRTIAKSSDHYSVNGQVAGSLKDAVDDFVPLAKGARRLSLRGQEQLQGTCVDGRTGLLVQAHDNRGLTYVNVYLDIPRAERR